MFFHFLELFKELFCEIIVWVMVRTKEGDKAGSNQPPTRDPVHFKLELMPNHWISRAGNTNIGSMRYVSMLLPNVNSILTKSREESNPGVARAAFSTYDQCKNLNQRCLRYACRFKSTNQHITTVGRSKPQPFPQRDVCLVAIHWLVDLNSLYKIVIFKFSKLDKIFSFPLTLSKVCIFCGLIPSLV